jgi:hypothetical protein
MVRWPYAIGFRYSPGVTRPAGTVSLKPRVIVDIRGLNRRIIPGAYP